MLPRIALRFDLEGHIVYKMSARLGTCLYALLTRVALFIIVFLLCRSRQSCAITVQITISPWVCIGYFVEIHASCTRASAEERAVRLVDTATRMMDVLARVFVAWSRDIATSVNGTPTVAWPWRGPHPPCSRERGNSTGSPCGTTVVCNPSHHHCGSNIGQAVGCLFFAANLQNMRRLRHPPRLSA